MQNFGEIMELSVTKHTPLLADYDKVSGDYKNVSGHLNTGFFSTMPKVLIKEIFSYLKTDEKIPLAHTSKYWQNYVHESRAVEIALAKHRTISFKRLGKFLIVYDITILALPIISCVFLCRMPLREKNKSHFILLGVNFMEATFLVLPCVLSIYEYGFKGIPESYLKDERIKLKYEFLKIYPFVNVIIVSNKIFWSVFLIRASTAYNVNLIANIGTVTGSLIFCRYVLGRRRIHDLLDGAVSLFGRIGSCFTRCRNRNREVDEIV